MSKTLDLERYRHAHNRFENNRKHKKMCCLNVEEKIKKLKKSGGIIDE